MLKLNPFAISGLLISGVYFPLATFIFIQGRTKLTKIYSLHLYSVFFWGIGSFLIATSPNQETAYNYWNFSLISVALIPVFFLHSVFLVTKTIKTLLIFAYLQAAIFIILCANGFLFKSMAFLFDSIYYYQGTSLYLLFFLIWEFLAAFAHIYLIIFSIKKFSNQERKIIICLFISIIGFIGGTVNFLPALGINIYPYGNFLIPVHSLVVTYAILKLQLFEINIVFKKSVIYSILFTTISVSYLVSTIISEKIIRNFFGYTSDITSIIMAFLIGLFLIPLRNKIQSYIDLLFFKTSPEDLINKHAQLEHKITQAEKLKSISVFASGMAHEIKNPLTSIKIFCEYLPKKIHDQEFLNKFIPIVTRDADRINELVHDLLEYAKPSPPETRPTDIYKLMEGVLDALSAQIVNKKIEIARDFDKKNIANIAIDAKQIKQALLNVFLNAVESIDSNGSLLITTRLSPDERKVILKITDNGCGISKEDLPHIFDPFFTKKEKGTGLGLSITHGVIKEHGGKIFVESALGRGTTFRIELPIRKS